MPIAVIAAAALFFKRELDPLRTKHSGASLVNEKVLPAPALPTDPATVRDDGVTLSNFPPGFTII
jgi:hypothetical protein